MSFEDLSDLPRTDAQPLIQLVMAQHDDLVASVRANEELGERRLASYLTVIAAVTAALGLASSRFQGDLRPLVGTAAVAAGLILVFGLMTLRRVMERNLTTTAYLNGLRRIRAFFAQEQPEIARVFAFPPERDPIPRAKEPWYGIGKGGLLETVAALNSILAGLAAGGGTWMGGTSAAVSAAVAAAVALCFWLVQMLWAARVYAAVARKRSGAREADLVAWERWAASR